mgnify:CR=1 FL=1
MNGIVELQSHLVVNSGQNRLEKKIPTNTSLQFSVPCNRPSFIVRNRPSFIIRYLEVTSSRRHLQNFWVVKFGFNNRVQIIFGIVKFCYGTGKLWKYPVIKEVLSLCNDNNILTICKYSTIFATFRLFGDKVWNMCSHSTILIYPRRGKSW